MNFEDATPEEADVVIVQHLVNLSEYGRISIRVICHDTNEFVPVIYFSNEKRLSRMVTKECPIAGRRVIDLSINKLPNNFLQPTH